MNVCDIVFVFRCECVCEWKGNFKASSRYRKRVEDGQGKREMEHAAAKIYGIQ